jgi:hypothetical protein
MGSRLSLSLTALALASVLASALMAPPARAADAVTDAIQAAYLPYRTALFKTNASSQAESEQAVADARAQFRAVAERYADKPPVPYDRDADFATTLNKVDEVLAKGESQIRARELAKGHQTIEEVRDLLGALRRRNGVVVYSDHMNSYHEEMEHLVDDGAATLAKPGGLMMLAGQAGVLDYLARRLRTEAPAALARDAEFGGLVGAVQASVDSLRAAIARQDEAAVREAIGKIKTPYSRLFVKFG